MRMVVVDSIDLASAITVSTGHQPMLSDNPPGQLQTFAYPESPEVLTVVTLFTTGNLSLPAKRLLACRSSLYKLIRIRGGEHVAALQL